MADSFAVARNRLILGLCLPLAILLGYLLAEPLEASTQAILLLLFGVLCVPLWLRWHHPILVFAWGSTLYLGVLGQPPLWIGLAFLGFLHVLVTRAVHPERKLIWVPQFVIPLCAFAAVVGVTAALTGGIGLQILGSDRVGGRGYVYIGAAILGFFALVSQRVPVSRAQLYAGLFFLAGLTGLASNLIYYAPPLYFLYRWFPAHMALDQWMAEYAVGDYAARIAGFTVGSFAITAFVLARYGLNGVFDLTRPWRLALLLVGVISSTWSGFRSAFLFQILVLLVLFTMEGYWKTRYAWVLLGVGLLLGAGLVGFSDRLPAVVQRSVSFLPVKVDPWVKYSAQTSTEWRLEMWKAVLPEVPRYLLLGKGYLLDANELAAMTDLAQRSGGVRWEGAAYTGDYHNGPLSVVIPFGIWGAGTFLWLLGAGAWVLRQNYRHGLPQLRSINALLLACYLTRVLFFFGVFGALYLDLYQFVGLVGLSIALNGGVRRKPEFAPAQVSPVEPRPGGW
ncbi:MAG: O-antigen ligase family protein [Verrucomicrobiales bacterium]|nr:O-antigen ligase family protein [Verrucomicrobiales bacterium]